MSSSTSSSDTAADAAAAPAWGRWLVTFVATLGVAGALVSALILIVDPYDSGFGLLGIKGVDDASPRTANASRARDLQFDSAVIGNSTGQLVKPSELSQLTGAKFVQVTTPGTGPREQLAVMDYFVRHHPRVGALVITADASWCMRDPALPLQHPFPFWLYGESRFDYVTRMFSSRALRHAGRRLMILSGRRQPHAADGYWDYEKEGGGEFAPVIGPGNDGGPAPANVSEDFPGVALLGVAIRKLPADVPVVLFVPPVFYSTLPKAGSAAAAEEAACKAALRKLVAGRARSNFIDFRVDNAMTRERANFMDFGHYRAIIARRMEQDIAASIKLGDKAKTEF